MRYLIFPAESPEILKNHTVILADGLGGFGVGAVIPQRCRFGTQMRISLIFQDFGLIFQVLEQFSKF